MPAKAMAETNALASAMFHPSNQIVEFTAHFGGRDDVEVLCISNRSQDSRRIQMKKPHGVIRDHRTLFTFRHSGELFLY
jgi:hypothetical protein